MSDAPTTPLPAVPAAPAEAALPAAEPRTGAPASCRACSAPLAGDQRYCLNCGTRVAATRVEWPAGAAGGGPAGAAPAAAPGRRGTPRGGSFAHLLDRVGGPMGAAAVVLVALGVGYLIGQSGDGSGGPATVIQRPPVINVQGGGAAAPGTAAEDADALDAGGEADAGGRAARAPAGGSGSTEGVAPATPDSAGGDLDRLQQQPTEQATQGAPPRRDDRPSGGGSATETIG